MKVVFDLKKAIVAALAATLFCAGALAQESPRGDSRSAQPQLAPSATSGGGSWDPVQCMKHPNRSECVKVCQNYFYDWCFGAIDELSVDDMFIPLEIAPADNVAIEPPAYHDPISDAAGDKQDDS